MRALLVILLGLVLAAPAAADPVSLTDNQGAVTATLSASSGTVDEGGLRDVHGLKVQIAVSGTVMHDSPLTPCKYLCSQESDGAGFAGLRVFDLDGDGTAEVLVDRSDGFNVCCTLETAILYAPEWKELDTRLGSGYDVEDRGGDAAPELVGDDVAFYTRFAPRVAGVYLPVRVSRFDHGAVRDVTKTVLGPSREQLATFTPELQRTERRAARRSTRREARLVLKPLLAAWAADEAAIGRASVARARLRRAVARHWVTAGYRRAVLALLASRGYL